MLFKGKEKSTVKSLICTMFSNGNNGHMLTCIKYTQIKANAKKVEVGVRVCVCVCVCTRIWKLHDTSIPWLNMTLNYPAGSGQFYIYMDCLQSSQKCLVSSWKKRKKIKKKERTPKLWKGGIRMIVIIITCMRAPLLLSFENKKWNKRETTPSVLQHFAFSRLHYCCYYNY